jgi:hypothetical protein
VTVEQERVLSELMPPGLRCAVVPPDVMDDLFGPLSVDAATLDAWSREGSGNYTRFPPPS